MSRDTSSGSGFESDRSCVSSVSGVQKKVSSIPDHSPTVSTKKIESIPKRPLKQVEISSIKQDKDIFRSKNFAKLQQSGIPMPCIAKGQANLPYVSNRTLDILIKWLSENTHVEWDVMRDKMSDSFQKKKGDEAKAVELYLVATMVDSTEAAILYLNALKEAKAALSD